MKRTIWLGLLLALGMGSECGERGKAGDPCTVDDDCRRGMECDSTLTGEDLCRPKD